LHEPFDAAQKAYKVLSGMNSAGLGAGSAGILPASAAAATFQIARP